MGTEDRIKFIYVLIISLTNIGKNMDNGTPPVKHNSVKADINLEKIYTERTGKDSCSCGYSTAYTDSYVQWLEEIIKAQAQGTL